MVPLSLGGFLSHFFFWPLFGPFAVCITLLMFTLIVSCETCGVPTFLCMESTSMHFVTFIISWHVARTSLLYKMAACMEESHFLCISFNKMKLSKDVKVWTYLPMTWGPLDWHKLKSSCPSFKIWLWGVNLSFNLALNAFHGKLPIRFGSTSFYAVHHSKVWSFKRDCANLNRSTYVLIAWDSK